MVNNNFEKPNITEDSLEGKEQLNFDFIVHASETPEDFLCRLDKSINKINKNKEAQGRTRGSGIDILQKKNYFADFNKEEYNPYYQKAFEILLNHNFGKDTLNLEKNNKVLQEIKFTKSTRDYNDEMPGGYVKDAHNSIKYFNNTNQQRTFFPVEFKKDSYPYSLSLFEVSNINSNEAKEYLRNKLNDKRICLLGGGKSMQDLLESDFIKPKEIINIDPFLDSEEINRNVNKNYKSLDLKADDALLVRKIEENSKEGKFDEIWASYSVPFYNTNVAQIDNLFNNIDSMLLQGGNCRITPLCAQNEECISKIMDKLKEMNESKEYNFDLLGDTLLIHKIKTEEKEEINATTIQKERDKERIKQLENELGI